MKNFVNTIALAALVALTAACTNDAPTAPGTATPEGGNQPGVEITLLHPVIDLAATATQADAATRANVASFDNIDLYAYLMKADGTVTQHSYYKYNGSSWATESGYRPLSVKGGAGRYYLRLAAYINNIMLASYTGTATVAADGSFTPDGALTPYTSLLKVVLKDADGTLLPTANNYLVYLRGAAMTDFKMARTEGNNYPDWNDDATLPRYNASGSYRNSTISTNGTATFGSLLPGTVPTTWNVEAEAYSPAHSPGTWGSTDILLSVYKKGTNDWAYDPTTGLPTNDSAAWHLRLPASKSTITLAPGVSYTLNVQLNGRDISLQNITTDIPWLDGGDWNI